MKVKVIKTRAILAGFYILQLSPSMQADEKADHCCKNSDGSYCLAEGITCLYERNEVDHSYCLGKSKCDNEVIITEYAL